MLSVAVTVLGCSIGSVGNKTIVVDVPDQIDDGLNLNERRLLIGRSQVRSSSKLVLEAHL